MSFLTLCIIGFLFGIGFGFFVQRSGLCFAQGLGEIFMGKGKRIIRLFAIILLITVTGFLVSGYVSKSLGFQSVGQIRGEGFFNIFAGILFGLGIVLNGGCVFGTLRQLGEGNLTFLVVLLSFIPGMALVVYGIDPLLQKNYAVKKILLSELFGTSPSSVAIVLIVAAVLMLIYAQSKKRV